MHPDLEHLIPLQRIDLDLRRHREEIAAAPGRLAAVAARSAEAQANLVRLEETLAREEKLRRSEESEIRSLRDRVTRLRTQMDTITTSAQASALEHQIAHSTAEASRLEDEELLSLERSESLETQLPSAREAVAGTESNLENERLRGADRTQHLQTLITTLDAERTTLRSAVSESTLSTYDRIARSRGTALAEGVDGKCSACQMLIRPQRWVELRDRLDDESILTCESCGRLLYWDPARDAPQRKAAAAATPASRKPPTSTPPRDPQNPKDRPDFGTGSIAARIIRGS